MYPHAPRHSCGKNYLHAEGAYPQLLHDSSVVLAAGTEEDDFLAQFLTLHTSTAFIEEYPVILVDGDEDTLAFLSDE